MTAPPCARGLSVPLYLMSPPGKRWVFGLIQDFRSLGGFGSLAEQVSADLNRRVRQSEHFDRQATHILNGVMEPVGFLLDDRRPAVSQVGSEHDEQQQRQIPEQMDAALICIPEL